MEIILAEGGGAVVLWLFATIIITYIVKKDMEN